MNATRTPEEFASALETFVTSTQKMMNDYRAKTYRPDFPKVVLSTQTGKRYIKVVQSEAGTMGRSVYCFVELNTGLIYKPAGWKAPAKHARGSIFGKYGVNPHGVNYLR